MTMLSIENRRLGVVEADTALALAEQIADRLAHPALLRTIDLPFGNWPQSLAHGTAGIALLHIERAARGLGPVDRVAQWLDHTMSGEADTGSAASLYYGAPALAFVLSAAAEILPGSYTGTLATLDRHTEAIVRDRLEEARLRRARGDYPTPTEFDVIRGLTGLGAYLLRRRPESSVLGQVLDYLVALAEPVQRAQEVLPGWWSALGSNGLDSPDFPGGHASNGLAHGIAGPLALLSLAFRQGITVDGHAGAIRRICAWLDCWKQPGEQGPWWPRVTSREEIYSHRTRQTGPDRPSWCNGTAGLARAQQLAALALADQGRQAAAEHALIGALSDPVQLAGVYDASVCHGYTGLAYIAATAATDAVNPGVSALVPRLLGSACHFLGLPSPHGAGLLEGAAGAALVLYALAGPSATCWDPFLLVR